MIFEKSPREDGADFRIEIERKFLSSRVNQQYVFPRKKILDSSSDSNISINQNQKQRTNSQENKPKLMMVECKSKRLKTEGNEKLDIKLDFKFESEQSEEEGDPGYYNKPEYKTLLIDLQKKLCNANLKVNHSSKAEVLPVSSKIRTNQTSLYSDISQKSKSKQSLKRTSSDHYRGSSTSIDKNKQQLKTTMDNYDKYERQIKSTKPKINKCSSKQNTFNTDVTPLMTKGSSAKKRQISGAKINFPQKVQEISKVYLQANLNSKMRQKTSIGKKPEDSFKTRESDQNLTQEYLLQILNKQSKPTKPAQINAQVQNPVFNLRNSNINVSLNFNAGLKKPQLLQQTMLVAELLKFQKKPERKEKSQGKYSQRCQSSQQYRCQTEPEEQELKYRRPSSNKNGFQTNVNKISNNFLKNKFKGLFIDVDL